MDMPFAKSGADPVYLKQMKDLLRRHSKTTIIWAHMGLGRVVRPVQDQASAGPTQRNTAFASVVDSILADPTLNPALAADALAAMASRFAELWLVQGYRDYDFDEAVEQLTKLMSNALGLPR